MQERGADRRENLHKQGGGVWIENFPKCHEVTETLVK